ncbi:MAG: hypothetical protein KBG22_05250 [Smithella sp.]|nr:hypothetical protein [Smithella sp.]HOU51805.1 hypothetical protein [Smithella sp.]HQG64272.1 hypothetical protein [Smithella sp.]HQH17205.1 hypothetical protein [Smithella sp.]
MNGSNFQIEQQCPQCGAPIILDETDRILSCKFCRTHVYLATDDHFRFYIPPAEGITENIYFIPYWRLKGLSFAIQPHDIAYKYFDANFLSFDAPLLPYSLGLRPQAMKLKFVGNRDNEGKFISAAHKTKDHLLKNFKTQTGALREVFIGETASVIYSPLYCRNNRVYDAVLKKPLDLQTKDIEVEQALLAAGDEKWHIDFLSLLCPDCGADLPGEKNALVLFCENCHSAWIPSGKNLNRVKFVVWPEKGDNITYLPFWQLRVRVSGLQLETYADLIKVANLPKVPTPAWQKTPFYFYTPAFKLNPALYLRWCKQLTAAPPPADLVADFPARNVHPATLPLNEALETSLVTLGSLMGSKTSIVEATPSSNFILEEFPLDPLPFKVSAKEKVREMMGISVKSSVVIHSIVNPDRKSLADLLPVLNFTLEEASLILHPFKMSARDLVHTKLGVSMDVNALKMGAYL